MNSGKQRKVKRFYKLQQDRKYMPIGGIRIEDNVLITDKGINF